LINGFNRFVFDYEEFKSTSRSSPRENRVIIPDSVEIELDEIYPDETEESPPTIAQKFATKFNPQVLKNFKDVADVSDVIVDARDVFHAPKTNHKSKNK